MGNIVKYSQKVRIATGKRRAAMAALFGFLSQHKEVVLNIFYTIFS